MSAAPAISEAYPLSPLQRGILFESLYQPEQGAYLEQFLCRLEGSLDLALFTQAWQALAQRHAVLRTAFSVKIQNDPVQVVMAHVPVTVTELDWSALTPDARDAALAEFLQEDRAKGFAFNRPPLFRLALARLAPGLWQMVWTHHHILMDGWSHPLLMADLISIYGALQAGQSPHLPPPVPYRDYIHQLARESRDAAGAYWREQFAGFERATPLGIDHCPAGTRGQQSRLDFTLTASETRSIDTLARVCQVSVSTVYQAAWALVLSRYSGQTDVTFGVTVSGRSGPLPGIQSIVGLLINTLPLRVDASGAIKFSEYLTRIGQQMRQMLNFESTDLADIRGWSGVPRGEALFESVLAFENFPLPETFGTEAVNLRITGAKLMENTSLPLTLIVVPGASTELRIAHDTARIHERHIHALARHLRTVFTQASRNPQRLLASIALEPDLAIRPASPNSEEQTLDVLFQTSAHLHPHRTAVTDNGKPWTYSELDHAAELLAAQLPQGAEYIGILLEKSAMQIVAMLAVLRTGAAYVPLDPAYPEHRLRYMLADSRCASVVTTAALAPLAGNACAHVLLDLLDRHAPAPPQPHRAPRVHLDSAAYVIYTSGSTGRPKGVIVTHRNVARLFSTSRAHFSFGPADTWTFFHSFSFDFSVWELWGALLYGGRVVVVPPALSRDTPAFYQLLAREKVTVLSQTPSAFRMLITHEQESRALPALSLRYVIFGGEALELPPLRHWFERHPSDAPELINMYGITETTVHVTWFRIDSQHLHQGSIIGAPLPDLDIALLDPFGNRTPEGLPGEICVGGAGLARGYLNLPALTADRFRPHPARPGERLYYSGDLARHSPSGLEYLGRLDRQVKVRGHRVELGEINAALELHPSVRQAFTQIFQDDGPARLAAYISCRQPLPVEELRAHLALRLPAYMIPEAFVFCPALPLTVNGKVDLRALPHPELHREVLSAQFEAPRNEAERALAEIWQTVLGVPRVGIHDNYFALGGDSIRSLRIASLAKDRGIPITLQQLFQAQTIAAIAPAPSRIEAAPQATEPFLLITSEDRALLPSAVEDAYPLGRLQAGMLFHSNFGDGQHLYIDAFSFKLQGVLDQAKWQAAVARSIARHPVLRTGFDLDSYSQPLQLVYPAADTPIEWFHDPNVPAGNAAERWLEQALAQRFDWRNPPLFRLAVHRLSHDVARFTLVAHHAILDGWSVASLLQEWSAASSPEGALPSFREFIALEQQALASPEQQRFWDEELADAPAAIVDSWPMPRALGRHGKFQRELPPELSDGIAAFARQHRLPVKTVLLAAWLRALEQLTGESTVVTGLVSNGRPEIRDSDRVLGLFLNTLPFRWSSPAGSWAEFCEAVLQKETALLPRRHFPLSEIQKRHGAPCFHTSFNYVHFHVLAGFSETSGLQVLETTSHEEVELPLAVNFSLASGEQTFLLGILYDRARYPESQVAFIGALLERVLQAMVAQPKAPHRSFRSAPAPQLPAERPVTILVPQRIAACALNHPERQAVWMRPHGLSYRDLDTRSSQLANYLVHHGVRPEEPVAVSMPRSLDMVVAILAVWKAGAFFVPVEPDLPAERRSVILSESGARQILTEETLPDLSLWPAIQQNPPFIHPQQLAYTLFTSGSTGKPKGVAVTHFGLANQIQWLEHAYPLNQHDRVLQKTPFGFDASVWEFWLPLSTGATLVMAEPGEHRDSAAIVATLQRENISILQVVPALLDVLIEEPRLEACTSLRTLFCGGEALKTSSVQAFTRKLPIPVVNLYGPTEATIQSSAKAFDATEIGPHVTIGPPLDNNRFYVLNSWGDAAGEGCPGELFIGGTALARGYYNQPALTAERFLPDPFHTAPGARMYRTGDKVRWLPDGRLEYLGRLDQQVKIRGFRVELSEVEIALTRIPGVMRAAVVVRDEKLHAFVAAAAQPAAIMRELAGNLPPYMLPASITVLENWPMLASGKIDRAALAKLVSQPSRPAPQLPRTPTEETLFTIWRGLLPAASFGITDDFFELGGDSILSLQLVARARRQGLNFTPKQVFAQPTVQRLAAVATHAAPSAAVPAAVLTGQVPLTPAQTAFFAQRFPNPHHWNQALLLELRRPRTATAIREQLEAVLSRHDALRLRFRLTDSGWVQEYGDFGFVWEERQCAPQQLEAVCSEVQRGLNISSGPLFRAALIHLTEAGTRLLLVAHHLIIDGVSWRILLDQFAHPALISQTVSFGEWARTLPAAPPEIAPTAPVPALPRDFNTGPNTEGAADTLHLAIPAALLTEAASPLRLTVQEMLLAALAISVSHWTGTSAVALTMESNGRDTGALDLSATVGWFTALWPLRLELPEHEDLAQTLIHLKPQMRTTRAAGPPDEISFNYLGRFDSSFPADSPFAPAPEGSGDSYAPESPRAHVLDFIALSTGSELRLQLRYSRNLHLPRTIELLLARVDQSIREMSRLAQSNAATAWSAADFPLAQIDEAELSALRNTIADGITDILPLSPVQEGMLFHSQAAGPGSGVYVQQLVVELTGPCDTARLSSAWRSLLARHPQLRTSFAATSTGKTVAVVPRHAEAPLTEIDWSTTPTAAALLEDWLAADRIQGFDPARAPLMRLALIRLPQGEARFIWTHHHAIVDGWSVPLVLAEVLGAYAGGGESAQPRLAWPAYLQWLAQQDQAAAESFWRAYLRHLPDAGTIAGPPTPGDQPAAITGKANAAALLDFARRNGLTLNTVVQAAWALVLGRNLRLDTVVIGATVSGRPPALTGSHEAIGMFINTLPVRISLSPGTRVRRWLSETQTSLQSVLEFQHTRLVDVQRWSGLPPGRSLFESIVVFENYPLEEIQRLSGSGGLQIQNVRSLEQNNYPLSLYVAPGPELEYSLLFQSPRLTRSAAELLLTAFEHVLAALPTAEFLGQLSLVETSPLPAEPSQPRPQPGPQPTLKLFPQRFTEAIETHGNRVALQFHDSQLTYRELDRAVELRAQQLLSAGAGPERITGILLDRSLDMVISLLAILRTGGAYLPMDPAFPASRIARMVEIAQPHLVISDVSTLPAPAALIAAKRPADIHPDQLAYVIFTSGSTGKPNGVQITHRALANLLDSFARQPGLSPTDTFLAVTTLSFDIATLEILLPLSLGATLHLASRDAASDGVLLARLLGESEATIMQATPVTWRMLLASGFQPAPGFRAWCGGEALPLDLARELIALGITLWNVYGPTETTIWSSARRVNATDDARFLGSPVSQTPFYILDTAGNLLPPGATGELWIGGVGLMRGYRAAPALTAERTAPDPFSASPGARIYRTGDLARQTAAGEIEFLGRADLQIKLDGHRIEIGDIEAALRAIPGVREAAVALHADPTGRNRLTGYIVPTDDADPQPTHLQAALAATLPRYMIPVDWITLPELPLTPNRKLDRKALPAPTRSHTAPARIAPRNITEEAVEEIWKEIFALPEIGVTANFFDLGGHSLIATQIHARLIRIFQTELSLRDLFHNLTVESLARMLTERETSPGRAAKIAATWLRVKRMTPEEKARALAVRTRSA